MLERRRNPASHGTVQLRLRKPSKAPQGQRTGGYGSVLRPGPMRLRRNKNLKMAGSQPVRGRDPGPRGLWARSPGAWGPGPQGLGPGPPGAWGLFPTPPNLSNYDFFANLLVGAWRRRGCRLKRLLRRWGPGGKRSRDTPPTPPPPSLRPFGRPPKSADPKPQALDLKP